MVGISAVGLLLHALTAASGNVQLILCITILKSGTQKIGTPPVYAKGTIRISLGKENTLEPFYNADLQAGRITSQEAYTLIRQFLIAFDMHYDHDMKMEGYADHELENAFVLGGCDKDGAPVYNALTEMFLRASREAETIFPKIKCRFSSRSPRAYLDEINKAVIAGTSTVLFHNDDAIPSLCHRCDTQSPGAGSVQHGGGKRREHHPALG